MRLKVEGTALERDVFSKAIINTDKAGYQSYLEQREAILSEKQRMANLEAKVDGLESTLDEIKTLLQRMAK